MAGVVIICLSQVKIDQHVPKGAIWALVGALFYAVYIVLLRKKIDNEDRVDIPMFLGNIYSYLADSCQLFIIFVKYEILFFVLGFVGLFNVVLIWPGFALLHYAKLETFEWPTKDQWTFLVINGLVGTVVSELLWLW